MRSGEHVVMKDLGLGSGFWTGHNNDMIKKYKRSAHFGSTYTKTWNDTEKISMAPGQGRYANSRSVPYF